MLFSFSREQPIDYGTLDVSLRKNCTKLGIKDVQGFINKCIQLFETTVVRHGLMLVGPTGSGKTKVYPSNMFSFPHLSRTLSCDADALKSDSILHSESSLQQKY